MMKIKTCFQLVVTLGIMLFGARVPLVYSAAPEFIKNTVLNIPIDRANSQKKVYIWQNEFGGSSDKCNSIANCKNKDNQNSLTCMSTTQTEIGACPSKLYWDPKGTMGEPLKLLFTHVNGQTKELNLTSQKVRWGAPSWSPSYPLDDMGFSVYILAAELDKLTIPGVWHAKLLMTVKAWDNCGKIANGCDGSIRSYWDADITLNVKNKSNPQIYLPAFPTAAPVIDLNLVTRSAGSSGKTVSGSASLDMCLYDDNDSTSNRISLLFQDEGAAAAGRPKGQFSLYRRGGDKSKARDRLDYQISVINPTTGVSQAVSNGKEIIWSDTNRRDIQRQVILPGSSAPALCVPAPLTLKTPAFSLADKTGGDFTGKLRIIYTPTTQ